MRLTSRFHRWILIPCLNWHVRDVAHWPSDNKNVHHINLTTPFWVKFGPCTSWHIITCTSLYIIIELLTEGFQFQIHFNERTWTVPIHLNPPHIYDYNKNKQKVAPIESLEAALKPSLMYLIRYRDFFRVSTQPWFLGPIFMLLAYLELW